MYMNMNSNIVHTVHIMCNTKKSIYIQIKRKNNKNGSTNFSVICDNQKWTNAIWLEFEIK